MLLESFCRSPSPIRGSRHEVTEGGVILYDKRLINNNLIRGTKDLSQHPLIGEEKNMKIQKQNLIRGWQWSYVLSGT